MKPLVHPSSAPLLGRVFFAGSGALIVLFASRMMPLAKALLTWHVRLDPEGAESQAVWSPSQLVRWQEARLLEIALERGVFRGSPGVLRCTLYGPSCSIRWRHVFGVPLPPGYEWGRILPLVAVHSGLEAHTFDRGLLANRVRSWPANGEAVRHHLLVLSAAATVLVGLPALAVSAPNRILAILTPLVIAGLWLYALYGPPAMKTRKELERAPLPASSPSLHKIAQPSLMNRPSRRENASAMESTR